MDIILKEDVKDLGRSGEIVKVSRGYARNFLIPQRLAVQATSRNLKQLEHQKRVIGKQAEKKRKATASLAEGLNGLSITVAKPVGENDRLYGSVTTADIVSGLIDEDIRGVDKKRVQLTEPIRQLGIYDLSIRLDAENIADIKVWVVAKE